MPPKSDKRTPEQENRHQQLGTLLRNFKLVQLRLARNIINNAIKKDTGYVRSIFASHMDISHTQQELQNHYRTVAPQIWEEAIKQIWLQVGKESITLHQAFFTGKGAVAYEKDYDEAEFAINYYDDEPLAIVKSSDDEWEPIPAFNFFEPEPELVIKTWFGEVEWKDVSAINDTWAGTVNDYIKDQADNRLSGVADTTWDGIKNTIADGIANGDSHIDIGKAVESQLSETWAGRGETIARTETAAASNYASLVTAQASASDLNKIWICSFVNSRDAHIDADSDYGSGSGIPQDEPFEVDGEDLDYPGDPSGSAENVINCMCSIGYEPASEEETSPTTEESGEGAQAAEGDEGVSALTGLTDDQTSQLSGLFDQLASGEGPLSDEAQSALMSQMQDILGIGVEAETPVAAATATADVSEAVPTLEAPQFSSSKEAVQWLKDKGLVTDTFKIANVDPELLQAVATSLNSNLSADLNYMPDSIEALTKYSGKGLPSYGMETISAYSKYPAIPDNLIKTDLRMGITSMSDWYKEWEITSATLTETGVPINATGFFAQEDAAEVAADHEVGHMLWAQLPSEVQSEYISNAYMDASKLTKYGAYDIQESFADNYAVWRRDASLMNPSVKAFYDGVLLSH
jgi:hypothetical protein